MPKTSSRAKHAITDYLHLGPTRTLPNLLQQYQQRQDAPPIPTPPDGPEKSTIDTDNLTLDVLTPTERAELLRLQSKIFTPTTTP
jgi:hypothetical protein